MTSTPIVIVGGGDGTLMAAVEHFEGSGVALGVLRLGTATIRLATAGLIPVIALWALLQKSSVELGANVGANRCPSNI